MSSQETPPPISQETISRFRVMYAGLGLGIGVGKRGRKRGPRSKEEDEEEEELFRKVCVEAKRTPKKSDRSVAAANQIHRANLLKDHPPPLSWFVGTQVVVVDDAADSASKKAISQETVSRFRAQFAGIRLGIGVGKRGRTRGPRSKEEEDEEEELFRKACVKGVREAKREEEEEEGYLQSDHSANLVKDAASAFQGISHPQVTSVVKGEEEDLGRLNPSSSPPPPKFRFIWDAAAPDDTGSAIKILSIDEMTSKLGITEIGGEVVCSKCHETHIIGFNLKTKSREIAMHISLFKGMLGDDGIQPGDGFLRSNLPPCLNCCNLTLEPVIPTANDRINWLFLFLGRMLGYCTVEQLDFFCKHSSSSSSSSSTSDYRTGGAKDRLLYLTGITVCKQLYPTGPFDP